MGELVLMRHGESIWNRDKRFTGWADIPLTERGRRQARRAGNRLKRSGFSPDICFSSCLSRAIETAEIVITVLGVDGLGARREWRLNERHYGALQGLSPSEAVRQYDANRVACWRRGFSDCPPAVEVSDPRHPANDSKYHEVPVEDLPAGESIRCAQQRVLRWQEETLRPLLLNNHAVLVVSHANLIKALIQGFEGLSDRAMRRLLVPVGSLRSYRLDEAARFERTGSRIQRLGSCVSLWH